jgi:acetyltransferase-like isoleucine patch superfamily enzyme
MCYVDQSVRARQSRGSLLKRGLKMVATGLALACMLPAAVVTGFGRVSTIFQLFAQATAMLPGKPGDYLRVAYYFLTLRKATVSMRVSFGTFFAHSAATIGKGVYIGAYCVLGACSIGDRTQIATHVQILSGARQHGRDGHGHILGAEESTFLPTSVGADCWLGASAIVMADVGPRTTIGAGAVVTRPIPADVVAVGNPARVIREVGA